MGKKTHKIGRDAETGKFLPVSVARRRRSTAIVESIKSKNPRSKT